jgi:hypothetical protein
MSARRTRRLKQFNEYPKPERAICCCIEQIMTEHRQPFEVVFPWAIAAFERKGTLISHAERTTNRKRLRRAWKALERERAAQRARLVRALAGT